MTNEVVDGLAGLLVLVVCAGIAAVILGADATLVTGLIESSVRLIVYAAIVLVPIAVLIQAVRR